MCLTEDFELRRMLFTRRFPEPIGIQMELTPRPPARGCILFSLGATADSLIGIQNDFAEHPDVFDRPFIPDNRIRPHIDDVEFHLEIMCAVVRISDRAELLVCGCKDNASPDMWITKGQARRGMAPNWPACVPGDCCLGDSGCIRSTVYLAITSPLISRQVRLLEN